MATHTDAASIDPFELLGLTPDCDESQVKKAYRKQALKYHPDKPGGDATLFHNLSVAQDILLDPAAREAFLAAAEARKARQRKQEGLNSRRKGLAEELFRAEKRASGSFKRKRDEDSAEERLAQELQRLQRDGEARRRRKEEELRRDAQAETEVEAPNEELTLKGKPAEPQGGMKVPELQRTVTVRFVREGVGESIDKDKLLNMFTRFGDIENTLLLKDKKQRIGDTREKKIVATGVIIYKSVVGAYTAIEDAKKQDGMEWSIFESVYWAEKKEPDFASSRNSISSSDELPIPLTPASTTKTNGHKNIPGLDSMPSTPVNGLKNKPSFGSFKGVGTPIGSPFSKGVANSPSLEEFTMIRLRNAEKKRMEEQIRREEAQASAE